jgi:hypothetical protein
VLRVVAMRALASAIHTRSRGPYPYASQSTSTQSTTQPQPYRLARGIAALFLASAAYQVLPLVPSALVEHAIKLMRTDKPFLQDAGMSRLRWLVQFEPARQKAMELGALEVLSAMDIRQEREQYRTSLMNTLSEKGRGGT